MPVVVRSQAHAGKKDNKDNKVDGSQMHTHHQTHIIIKPAHQRQRKTKRRRQTCRFTIKAYIIPINHPITHTHIITKLSAPNLRSSIQCPCLPSSFDHTHATEQTIHTRAKHTSSFAHTSIAHTSMPVVVRTRAHAKQEKDKVGG